MQNVVRSGVSRRSLLKFLMALTASRLPLARAEEARRNTLYAVPNFHPGCMGWLAPYHVERNYCLHSYLDHQDLTVKDPNYKFAFSEIPHLITMMEMEPERFEELKGLVKQGRVELVNAYVLEPTINLSGGEALVMQGVEGLRWYQQVMNASPRYCWMIDITGWHEQMAQIVSGLELEAFVYCRYNPTAEDAEEVSRKRFQAIHWIESPDGTRALALNPGHYSGAFKELMITGRRLPAYDDVWETIEHVIQTQRKRFPEGAPLLVLAGQDDYSLSFNYKGYPTEMLQDWDALGPDTKVQMATLSDWFDVVKPEIAAGKYELKVVKTGSKIYGWSAFWVNAPKEKQWYRRSEHALQAAEAITTIASLKANLAYPAQDFSNAWFLMSLNMDRGLLWGICVSGVYTHPKVWDARDRFELVDATAASTTSKAIPALLGPGRDTLGLFNPSNWERDDLLELTLPAGKVVAGAAAQVLEDGKITLVETRLPSLGLRCLALKRGTPPASKEGELPETIETNFYSAKVDANTGALVSLKLKPSGRQVLGGGANVILAETESPGALAENTVVQMQAHEIPVHSKRTRVASSSDQKPVLTVRTGPLATILEMKSAFPGGGLRRVARFYKNSPRIDFVTETNDLPDGTIVSAEFPFAEDVTELRRAIPYGFSQTAWSTLKPEQRGNHNGIVPVIRWSHYLLAGGGGVALMDRGVPGRELVDRTAIVYLHNACGHYYWDRNTDWMSGKGKQSYQYALLAHETNWNEARIPQLAWDFNAPPLVVGEVKLHDGESYVETSDNVIVEALRRVGDELEMRLVESKGAGGRAMVKVDLPHQEAALTDMLGQERTPLSAYTRTGAGSAEYRFDIRPQQIVTLRLKVQEAVAPIKALTTFDPVVPEAKRLYTRSFKHPELKGHTPEVGMPEWKAFDK
jgi:alpha-mannosidase